ncbi:SgcJ/EcaC family oxidoreductase [Glycomyces sp. TRM65418]|uniref:SgcJ/EcaC family oxidoreductase n=1 Tax=Glycomyces sp. TRM65418 TaxID=2867006 RepID=UPI001CE59F85|nr:SgcJ/EcaC family oxidoreductase [Glycomyces sp. TRM65418]MCC3763068.1 SgcJ/EcaC family oxidoreductase [Glycomyces sp. TRM65418]QZD57080.1 SgcJ/EcaC family oxidoreductase [Glycomyces sp. TRM65418]
MRRTARITAVIAAAAALLTAGTAAADDRGGPRDDQAAFDELRERQEQAWIDEDGEAFAATFHEDGDVVAFNGDHMAGREAIAERMQYYFDEYIEGARLHMLSEHVRYVERDVVVIVRTGCQIEEGETECRPDSFSTNTNVLTREHGEWLQTSFQNTRQFAL